MGRYLRYSIIFSQQVGYSSIISSNHSDTRKLANEENYCCCDVFGIEDLAAAAAFSSKHYDIIRDMAMNFQRGLFRPNDILCVAYY